MNHTDVSSPADRTKVLFMAEAVTLAHVARPVVLAQSLDPQTYDVTLAADPRMDPLFPEFRGKRTGLDSVPTAAFLDALARGKPLYDLPTLRSYVADDLAILEQLKPDLVVGDFRLSLSVSARLARIPYLNLINAYWSPYARQRFPVPELPVTRWLGYPAADVLFQLVRPAAFAYHARPLNRLRREHGMPSLGGDIRRVYCDADYTLYADVPELWPTYDAPATHRYLGPVVWSPELPLPSWWERVPPDRPAIYVTLGSSGAADLLPRIIEALAAEPISLLVATAKRVTISGTGPGTLVADYLPGSLAARRASLVVCNGGSPTTHQALAEGVPVLGIPTNLDQCLNMAAIEAYGAGKLLRPGHLGARALRSAVAEMLGDPQITDAARRLAAAFAGCPAAVNFEAMLREALALSPLPPVGGEG